MTELLQFCYQFRRWLMWPAAAGLLLGVAVAIFEKPVYQAEIKVVPVDRSRSDFKLSEAMGSLGGLAALASLGGSVRTADSKSITLEILKSRTFTRKFLTLYGLEPVIASAKLGPKSVADQRMSEKAIRIFDQEIRSVTEDRRTGIVSVAIDWTDPIVAANWANNLVALLNSEMRARAVAESKQNLAYLHKQLTSTEALEVRTSIFKLVESEVQDAMIAEVREEYALKIIDRAVPPFRRDYVRPNRPLLVIGGAMAGLFAGFILAGLVNIYRRANLVATAGHDAKPTTFAHDA